MRKLIFLLLSVMLTSNLLAQQSTLANPKLSPFQKTEIKIGLVDVTLEYSRPSMRGRKIFGGLEPYGKMWRTGANKNTRISFSHPVVIGDVTLPAGAYTIFTKPNTASWEVYFHTELDEYGVPDVVEAENILATISVPVTTLNRNVETLSIAFDDLTRNSAMLAISWERTYVSVLIQAPSDELIKAHFKEQELALASSYSISASIYFEIENDNVEALKFVDKAIELREKGISFNEILKADDFNHNRLINSYSLKAEILQEMNQNLEALEYANRALTMAKKIKSEYWINVLTKNIAEWKAY